MRVPVVFPVQAGIASPESPELLLISLEPEASSISVRREKLQDLVPESPPTVQYLRLRRSLTPKERRSISPGDRRSRSPDQSRCHSEPRTLGAVKNLGMSALEFILKLFFSTTKIPVG